MPPNISTFDVACGCGGAAGFEAYSDKIDCLRSVRPGILGVVGPVLDGLCGGADCVPPKKSNPSKLSPALVCFGAATGAFGGPGLCTAGSVVLGLTGAASTESPNKSTSCGLTLGGCGSAPLPFLCCPCVPLLALARSCTTFNGTSSSPSSPSNVAGSLGTGPSIAHRLESYFVRIKLSILPSFGTCPSASLCSQYRFARLLPHFTILASCSSVHESRSMDFTREMWTPRERWMPEQRMQTKTPRFQEAQRGCLLRLQSAQSLLLSSLVSVLSAARLRSVVSTAAGARRDIVVVVVVDVRGREVCESSLGGELEGFVAGDLVPGIYARRYLI